MSKNEITESHPNFQLSLMGNFDPSHVNKSCGKVVEL